MVPGMIKRTLFLTTTAVAVSAALFAGGCGSDDNSGSSDDATAASTTNATASAPYGTYVRQLTKVDIERTQKLRDQAGIEDGPNMSAPKPGEVRLIIAKGARGDVVKTTGEPGSPTIDMDAYFDGDAMQATNYVDVDAFCGPAISVPATYTVTTDGDSLTLKPKTPDPCPDRDASWTGTWQKR